MEKVFPSRQEVTCFANGVSSDDVEVLPDVSQGSILGPWLLHLDINGLPESLPSNVRLFADDTIAYLTINS